MQDEAPLAPDTHGLPEYTVSAAQYEIVGGNVRLVCGARRFGHMEWLYTVLLTPEDLMQISIDCRRVAEAAFCARMMTDQRKSH